MTLFDGIAFVVSGALILFALLDAFGKRWGK